MNTEIKINSTGALWPRLGFGTWKTEPANVVVDAVYNALKSGYRHLDCAATYGNEQYVGLGIKKAMDEGIVKREDLWVTSKLWNTDHAPEHVEAACRRTLTDLGLEYLDLYLIHFPMPLQHVPNDVKYPAEFFNDAEASRVIPAKVPLSATWGAMETLVEKKLVRHLGVSNFDLQLLQDLLTYCKIAPITNQIELHPYFQQNYMVRYCQKIGLAITAYSPLGGKSYVPLGMVKSDEINVLDNPVIQRIASQHKRSPAQVVLRWILQRADNITVIPKSASTERMQENSHIFDFKLTDAEMEDMKTLNCGRRYNDTAVYTNHRDNFWPIFASS